MAGNWSVSGQYCEACDCEAACPCVMLVETLAPAHLWMHIAVGASLCARGVWVLAGHWAE